MLIALKHLPSRERDRVLAPLLAGIGLAG